MSVTAPGAGLAGAGSGFDGRKDDFAVDSVRATGRLLQGGRPALAPGCGGAKEDSTQHRPQLGPDPPNGSPRFHFTHGLEVSILCTGLHARRGMAAASWTQGGFGGRAGWVPPHKDTPTKEVIW